MYDHEEKSVLKGVLAGLAGGLAAAGVMNLAQRGMGAIASEKGHGAQSAQPDEDQEDAAMKTAEAVSETVTGDKLTREQKHVGGVLVHYAFGAAMGALYGALAEVAPKATLGRGAPFGAGVWVGADEVALPALGLSKGPMDYPASTHAQALTAHLVYGLTMDACYRLLRRAL